MPAGALVTVPVPVPDSYTESDTPDVCLVKVAVTVVAAAMPAVQVAPLVEVQPDQLTKVEPASGVAVSVTLVFCG